MSLLTALLAASFSGACAPAPQQPVPRPPDLAAVVDSIVATPPLQRTHWGIEVFDPAAHRVLLQLNADRHFIPASNTKLVATITAMGLLGPDFHYRTPLLAQAVPGDSVARSLLVVGSGDPTMSARFDDNDFAPLDSLAATVAAAGIRRVAGSLVVDASRFSDSGVNEAWEVGDLPWTYAAPTGAFAIGEGGFQLVVTPGMAPGDSASCTEIGGPALQPVHAELVTDTAGARARWDVSTSQRRDTVFVKGRIAAGASPDTMSLAVIDPNLYAARALAAALRRQGITLDGDIVVLHDSAAAAVWQEGADPPYRTVATRLSPPLAEIVAALLKPSQNWMAEQLLKTLGAQTVGEGSWRTGLAAERQYLVDTVGLDSLAFHLRDGSGLSAQDLLTPAAFVQLLAYVRRQPWGETFRFALAEPGVAKSTLEHRLSGLEGRIYAKTGTIANVNSLSGYVISDSGRELIFSILTNGSGLRSGMVRRAIDQIVRAIAREGEAP